MAIPRTSQHVLEVLRRIAGPGAAMGGSWGARPSTDDSKFETEDAAP
jgi:hypothetical protein